jgi:hypothetical protein
LTQLSLRRLHGQIGLALFGVRQLQLFFGHGVQTHQVAHALSGDGLEREDFPSARDIAQQLGDQGRPYRDHTIAGANGLSQAHRNTFYTTGHRRKHRRRARFVHRNPARRGHRREGRPGGCRLDLDELPLRRRSSQANRCALDRQRADLGWPSHGAIPGTEK